MANRYWVGGTGTWDGTSTVNWSASSGGAIGASVPTAADNVFFDVNSNVGTGSFTVTMATTPRLCNDFTASGLDGAMTLAGTSIGLTVSGSLTFQATNFNINYTGTTTFNATTTGKTVTTNGVAFGGSIDFNGVGGGWTLGSALTNTGSITLTNGTFDTSSVNNYSVTASAISSSNSNARTINLNASTVTLGSTTSINFTTSTNLTFNAGTSTINCSSNSITFNGGSLTYYNVAFTSTATTVALITGANTFNNLSVAAPSAIGVTVLGFDANQTINGALTTTGTAGNRRVWIVSGTYGIGFTLTCNSAASLTDTDFRDIYVIGTAAPISGTRIGNRGNCSGITFDAAKTVYWNLAGAQNWSANAWATTSAGTPSTDNFPLPQDTATFTNAGSVTGTITFDSAITFKSSVDMSARTTAMTLAFSNSTVWYGDWKNGSGTTLSGTAIQILSGGSTQTITSAGKTFSCSITVDTYGGTVQLADALNIGANGLTVTNGTFTTAGFAITAASLSSSNSNVRAINLGASTVSFSATGNIINISTSTNLTFNAGTSQINVTQVGVTFPGAGQTFYNLSFTSNGGSATSTIAISGANTFNNLSFTAPTSAGFKTITFLANQTINGTLTCSTSSAVQRAFLASDTIGTQRTLTVNSLSATDTDFRDIVIAGTASGSSPTRAGDCGNNSGITFPVAKTVYWNLAGSQNWSATGWCTGSGGTPAVNNFPLAQDTAVFDDAGSAGTVTIQLAWNIGTFNAGARTSAVTITNNVSGGCFLYGNLTLAPGGTYGGIQPYNMGKVGTQTITSNGRGLGNNLNIQRPQTTVVLADALNMSGRTILHQAGTFDAVTYNVTMGTYSGGGTSTLYMGSGTWTIDDVSGTYWAYPTTLYVGTANIVLSGGSTFARTFSGGGLYYNKLTIGGTIDTFTLTITGNNTFGELASTKTVAHTIAFGTTTQNFGKWSVTGTVGNVVTITGTSTTNLIAGPAVTGVDYLAMGTWGISTNSPGEFYAGANSTGSAAAPVFRTAAPTPRTLYWVGGTGNWSSTTKWSTSSGGASGSAIPTSLDAVNFDSLSNATAYTATIDAGVTPLARCASFTMAGPLTGNVTWSGSVSIAFHGNVSFTATGITRSYVGGMVWAGNSSYTFTTNGLSFASQSTLYGIGATWTLGSAFTASSFDFVVTYGTFSTSASNYAFTPAVLDSNNSNIRTINLNASTVTTGTSVFPWLIITSTNATLNAGTSTIIIQYFGPTFYGGGLTYYNVSFTSTAITTVTMIGANTFNNLSLTGRTTVGSGGLSLSADQTINGTLTVSAGTASSYRMQVSSNTLGTTRTLTCAAVSLTDTDFRDITIAGAASPASGTRLGNSKGNSGITFPAAKTVFYRQTGSANWGATGSGSWSATSGGALDATQFPLAQDTAVFPAATYPASGSTTTINAAYSIGTIDMSLRTSNTMTLATGTNSLVVIGNWINGTGITLSGTGTLTFAGRTTQTITSAAKTFTQPITINTPSGSVTLQDALTMDSTRTATLTNGTLDLNGFTHTVGASFLTSTGTKNLTFNGGTLVCPATLFNNANPTNFTTTAGTGTGTISMTAATAKTFVGGDSTFNCTLNQGGAGTLTVSGNNTFANITNTAVGATTINLGTTTQTVGAWTATGTVGNLLTITGTSAASSATLIYTGVGNISGLNYLVPTFVRAYSTTSTWYAGANSTNGGSLGWIFDTASGNIYNVFFIDTATATDAILGLAVFLSALSETATATDSPSVAASTFNAPIAETATATDSPSVAASTFNAPVEETATATDSGVGFILFPVSITETATATDSILGLAAFSSALVEIATATDSVLSFAAFSSTLSETATATDSVISFANFYAALAETATATDSPLVAPSTFNAPIAETATATDSPLVAPSTFNAPIAETATATDSPLVAPSTFNAPVSETVTISDLVLGLYLWNLIDDSQSVTWQNINSSPGTTWSPIDTDPDTGWSVIPTVN